MDSKLKLNFKNIKMNLSEIKHRVFFLIFALIIFRLGSFIPVPGIDTVSLSKLLKNQPGTIIEMLNIGKDFILSLWMFSILFVEKMH